MHLSGYDDSANTASQLAPFPGDVPRAGETWDSYLTRARQTYYALYHNTYTYRDTYGSVLPPDTYTQIVGPDPQARDDYLCLYSKSLTGGVSARPYKQDPNLFFSGLLTFGGLLVPAGIALYSAITAGTLGSMSSLGVGAPSLTSSDVAAIYSDAGYSGVEAGSGSLDVGAPSLSSSDVSAIYGDAGYTGEVGSGTWQTVGDAGSNIRSLTSEEVQALYGDQGYAGLTADQLVSGAGSAAGAAGGSMLPSLQQAAGLATTAAGVYSAFSKGGALPGGVPGVDGNLYAGAPNLPLLANNNMLYAIGAAVLVGIALLGKKRGDKAEKMFD